MSTVGDAREAEYRRLFGVLLDAPMPRTREGKVRQISHAEYVLTNILGHAINRPVTFEAIAAEIERYNARVAALVAAEQAPLSTSGELADDKVLAEIRDLTAGRS